MDCPPLALFEGNNVFVTYLVIIHRTWMGFCSTQLTFYRGSYPPNRLVLDPTICVPTRNKTRPYRVQSARAVVAEKVTQILRLKVKSLIFKRHPKDGVPNGTRATRKKRIEPWMVGLLPAGSIWDLGGELACEIGP